jgi:hypothetical protein
VKFFTIYGRKDIFTYNVKSVLAGAVLADNRTLSRLTERYVDDAFLEKIARERRKDRTLLIGTMNLDAQSLSCGTWAALH